MAPMYGEPNYDFLQDDESSEYIQIDNDKNEITGSTGLTEMAFWYMVFLLGMLLTWLLVLFLLRIMAMRQKTRSPQQRRMYVGTRARQSLSQPEPTIYVSPANLPPPPKYEAMAPPSYEEVCGVHGYPSYTHIQPQPITQPLHTAMAQTSNATTVSEPSTVITVTAEDRRTSVTVSSS